MLRYSLIDRSTTSTEELYQLSVLHAATPHNFIPDWAAHRRDLESHNTVIWTVHNQNQLVGFITATTGSEYWENTGHGRHATAFIHDFAVDASIRGKGVGTALARLSLDRDRGIWSVHEGVEEIYTTVHADNIASRTAFIKAGYREVMTYKDAKRDRYTTVLKASRLASRL